MCFKLYTCFTEKNICFCFSQTHQRSTDALCFVFRKYARARFCSFLMHFIFSTVFISNHLRQKKKKNCARVRTRTHTYSLKRVQLKCKLKKQICELINTKKESKIVTINFLHLRRSYDEDNENDDDEETVKNSIACINIYVDIVWNSTLYECYVRARTRAYVCVYMGAFDIDLKSGCVTASIKSVLLVLTVHKICNALLLHF